MGDIRAELTDSDDLEITNRVRQELGGPHSNTASESILLEEKC